MNRNLLSSDSPGEAVNRLPAGEHEGRYPQLSPVQRLPSELIELIARHVASKWDADFYARFGGSASRMAKRAQEASSYCLVCRSWSAPFRRETWRSVNLSLTPPISPFWLRLAEVHMRGGALSCNIKRLAITENEQVSPPELAAAKVLIAKQLPAALSSVHELHLVGQSAPELWFGGSPRPLRYSELVNLSLYLQSPFQKPAEHIYVLADIPTLRRLTLRVREVPELLAAAREAEQACLQYAPASDFQRIPLEVFSFQWTALDLDGRFTVTWALDHVFTLDEVKSIKLGPARFNPPTLTRLASLVNLESLTIASWPDVLREYTIAIDTILVDMGNLKELRLIRRVSTVNMRPSAMSLSLTETIRLLHALPATLQAFELEVNFPASAAPDLRIFLGERRRLPLVQFDVSLRHGCWTELFAWDKDRESGWVRRGNQGQGGNWRASHTERM
ncbi:uncharacterized protein JCM10292_002108 [Rhodotorula paludigena]|uniref:uncharacterized protein n=1 Tax=Rhodotorula paludigena TaxID=86838 RepID=UPI00317EBC13